MAKIEIGNYLVIDPEICHGQMTFRCTRVTIDTVLTFLVKDYTIDQLLRSWPELQRSAAVAQPQDAEQQSTIYPPRIKKPGHADWASLSHQRQSFRPLRHGALPLSQLTGIAGHAL